jgi:pimeloyl-ACP methyl ester carboxylesterase
MSTVSWHSMHTKQIKTITMREPTLYVFLAVAVLLSVNAEDVEAGERRNVRLAYGQGQTLSLTVVYPLDYSAETAHPLVLALPPGPGTLEMVDAFLANYWLEEADRRGYILVSPAVFGPELETSAREVVDAVFGWLEENVSFDPERVTLTGQSNGGLGAFHVARVEPDRFSSMVVMPGGYGSGGDLVQLAGMPVLLAVGERDTQWVGLVNHTRDLLVLADAEPQVEVIPGAGHVFPYSPRRLFDWIELSHPE